MRAPSLLLTMVAGVLACRGTPDSNAAEEGGGVTTEQTDETSSKPPAPPRDRSITIGRGETHVPHEVELDPRGEVALTIDPQGGLRLWPAIRSGDPKLSSPYVLPMREPLWMSLAQAEDGFVVATIDTTNAGQVVGVTPSADGQSAKLTPLFATPPGDPLLELHALDGGQRFLALGVDHRVRLYDRKGELVSVIDQRSFAPWQLRVVHGEPGQPPKIAAMLAQPLRVQAIELRDDRLAIKGEAHTIVLDRGPNRNDLLLSPDGKTVAGLRRRSGRSREFSIELIDLETGARRLLAGETDSTIRSRMHFVSAERILLETGSGAGRGLWVELAKAEAFTDPADADPEGKLAKRLAKTKHDSIPLAASAEHRPENFDPEFDLDWDRGERLYASVVGGLRVAIERDRTNKLIVDPLDSDRHWAIAGVQRKFDQAALDFAGNHVAFADAQKLWVVRMDGSTDAAAELEHGLRELHFLSFVDERHVLLVEVKGKTKLIDWQGNTIVASTKLDNTWGIAGIAFRPNGQMGGVLGYGSGKPGDPIRLLPIDNGQLGTLGVLARDQRGSWLDVVELGDAEAGGWFGMTESQADDNLDEYTSDRNGRMFYTKKNPRTPLIVRDGTVDRSISLPAGQGRVLSVSPDGSKIAIVQFRARDDGFSEDHLLSIFAVESGERLWTIGSPKGFGTPGWAGDGKRILVQGTVRDAATGEVVNAAAHTATLVIEDRSDADWARQTDFLRP
jgi:hypothetical protein